MQGLRRLAGFHRIIDVTKLGVTRNLPDSPRVAAVNRLVYALGRTGEDKVYPMLPGVAYKRHLGEILDEVENEDS